MCMLAKSYLASLPLGIIPGSLNVAFAKLDKTIRVRIPSHTGIATVYSFAKEGHLKAKRLVRQKQVKACKFSRRGHNFRVRNTQNPPTHTKTKNNAVVPISRTVAQITGICCDVSFLQGRERDMFC